MENNQTISLDDLIFLEEPEKTLVDVDTDAHTSWRVMIIDDDPDVHTATTFALGSLIIQGRPLTFLHAYTADQAKTILQSHHDIAVILLDVVMEHDDTGLQLVSFIRHQLGLDEVRLILRTGQPGYAPEIDAIRDFDINDYKTKSELTRTKLFTTVTSAIRSYEQICIIKDDRHGANMITSASRELISQTNLHDFSCIITKLVIDFFRLSTINYLLIRKDEQTNSIDIITSNGQFALPELPTNLRSFTEDDLSITSGIEANPTFNAALIATIETCLEEQANQFSSNAVTLYLRNTTHHRYVLHIDFNKQITASQIRFLTTFSSNVSVCLDNVLLNSRLREHAFTDPLTQLPNRLKLLLMLDQVLSTPSKSQTTLALIDIDHFAETNNALGHQFGDLLLCAVADRLRHHFHLSCKLARIGSDTFSLLGHNAIVQPEAILSLFYAPFQIDKQVVQVTATIGLVNLIDYEGNTSDALKDTNIALKRAKTQQRSGYVYFTSSMGVEIRERVSLMHALHNAFEKNHLFVVYQPQVDIQSGAVVGAEALLRWRTEEGKFIPPDQFIPIAEYSGLIIELGDWVLNTACLELQHLIALGHTNFKMSVNVSQAQFLHPEFLNSVRSALHVSGIPPALLDLEITESMAMEDPDFLMEILFQLKHIGVKISIDDFGTGFSSLSYLQKLAIDQLKIDRSFVNQIVDINSTASIPKMIIQLCQSLGLSVIAEGVEDASQAQALAAFGCPLAQGFFYARPMESHQLITWLEQRQ